MLYEIFDRSHDLGYACLVVGSEQGGAVGHDELLSLVVEQFGKFRGREHYAGFGVEGDVAAVVGRHYAGVDVASAHVGRGVEMRYESHCGQRLRGVGRKGGHKIAVFVQSHFCKSEFAHFPLKIFREFELSGCRRGHIGEFVALGVELHVVQKSVDYVHDCMEVLYGCQSGDLPFGRENLNSSPEGLILCTEMVPPMLVNVLCTMGSPRPVPPLLRALPSSMR